MKNGQVIGTSSDCFRPCSPMTDWPRYLFSMASMFLRSTNTCRELSPSLSEKRRWWPVTHRVPLVGGWNGCRRTTSSTFAVLMCSENSITICAKPKSRGTAVTKVFRDWGFRFWSLDLKYSRKKQLEINFTSLPLEKRRVCSQMLGCEVFAWR